MRRLDCKIKLISYLFYKYKETYLELFYIYANDLNLKVCEE